MSKDDKYQISLEGHGMSLKRDISLIVAHKIVDIVLGSDSLALGQEHSMADPGPDKSPNVSDQELSPKVFMDNKIPKTDIEKITCLAYYLTHYRNTKEFKTRELTDLNREAAQPKFSNPSVSVRNAATANYNYLTAASVGKKQITSFGEDLVKALPDRDKVKAVLAKHRGRKRRRTKLRKSSPN